MGSPLLAYEDLELRPALWAILFLPLLFGGIMALLVVSFDASIAQAVGWISIAAAAAGLVTMTQYGSVSLQDGTLRWRSGLRSGELAPSELEGIEVFYPDMPATSFLPGGALYAPPMRNKPGARPERDMATFMTLGTTPPVQISLNLIGRRRRQRFLEALQERLVDVEHGDVD